MPGSSGSSDGVNSRAIAVNPHPSVQSAQWECQSVGAADNRQLARISALAWAFLWQKLQWTRILSATAPFGDRLSASHTPMCRAHLIQIKSAA